MLYNTYATVLQQRALASASYRMTAQLSNESFNPNWLKDDSVMYFELYRALLRSGMTFRSTLYSCLVLNSIPGKTKNTNSYKIVKHKNNHNVIYMYFHHYDRYRYQYHYYQY